MLIDGGLGQLHAAAQALEKLEIINQPVAAIAKQEEILYSSSDRKTSRSASKNIRRCCT